MCGMSLCLEHKCKGKGTLVLTKALYLGDTVSEYCLFKLTCEELNGSLDALCQANC